MIIVLSVFFFFKKENQKEKKKKRKGIKRVMTWLVPKLQVTLVEEHKTQSHKKRPFGHNLHSNLCNNLFCVKFDILESFELHFLSTYIHTHTLSMALGLVFPSFMQVHQPPSLCSFNSSTVRKTVLARNSNGQEPSSTGSIAVKEKKAFPGTLSVSL